MATEEEAPRPSSQAAGNVVAGTLWCFICGKRIGASGRSSSNIFVAQASTSQQQLSTCISSVLQTELQETDVQSQVVCKMCHKTVNGIDVLERQLAEMRDQVKNRHRKTMKLLAAGELPPDQSPAVNDEIKTPTQQSTRKSKLIPRADLEGEQFPVKLEEDDFNITNDDKLTSSSKETGLRVIKEALLKDDVNIQETSVPTEVSPPRKRRGRPPGSKRKKPAPASKREPKKSAQDEVNITPLMRKLEEMHHDDDIDAMETAAHDSSDPDYDPKDSPSASYLDKEDTLNVKEEDMIGDDDLNDFEAVFSCTACEARFGIASALINHLKKRHGIHVLLCDLCGLDFDTKEELKSHMDEKHAPEEELQEIEELKDDFDPDLDIEGDFQCEICNKLFSSLRMLTEHKRCHYGKNFICEICHKRYASRSLLQEHQNMHTGQRPYECQSCNKTFASKYCLKIHLKTHEVRPRPYACPECGKSFMKPEHLTQHERTHVTQKDFVCDTCGKGFSSSRNLEVHTVVHTGYKPFVCRTCGKAFARRAEITDHERIHTGERPYQCETCGATFSQRSNLQSHKRATHLDDRRFVCNECGKSFKRRRLLDYHTRSVHTGERPYSCSECSATFVYPEHFKKHRRIHTGEKPFKCEVCGKAFNSRDNRNAHRFIHSNKKPYECLVCGVGFMRKPLLYNHMQTQGHMHDTIVVNQPQVPGSSLSQSNVVSEAAAAAGISGLGGSEKVYVTSQDDPEPQHVEEVEHILIEGPVHFAADNEVIEDSHENSSRGSRTATLLVPANANMLGGGSGDLPGNVQLVQIHFQEDQGGGSTPWINLSALEDKSGLK